jgi:hypothetical protein
MRNCAVLLRFYQSNRFAPNHWAFFSDTVEGLFTREEAIEYGDLRQKQAPKFQMIRYEIYEFSPESGLAALHEARGEADY